MTQNENWKNIRGAKNRKNDEYYTRYEDIDKHFRQFDFTGLHIYCPCDDYRKSQFVKWFKDNYDAFKLKGLTATCYIEGGHGLRYDYDGHNEKVVKLDADGDFRSDECSTIRDATDCVVTNPPFSLVARYFHKWVRQTKYAYLSFSVAVSYSDILDDLKTGKMTQPRSQILWKYDTQQGEVVVSTIIHSNIHTTRPLQLRIPTVKYDPANYERYDNYDAINIDNFRKIPCDYYGKMGVPISTIARLDLNQFDIIGLLKDTHVNRKKKFMRIIIQRKKEPSL